jgi:hypothetical protein
MTRLFASHYRFSMRDVHTVFKRIVGLAVLPACAKALVYTRPLTSFRAPNAVKLHSTSPHLYKLRQMDCFLCTISIPDLLKLQISIPI